LIWVSGNLLRRLDKFPKSKFLGLVKKNFSGTCVKFYGWDLANFLFSMKNISSPTFGVKMLPSPNVGTWKNFQSWDLEKFFHVQMLGLGKIFGLGLEKIFTSENSSKSQPENSSKTQHLDLGREKNFSKSQL
jgi:hypothetical protein